MKHCKELFDIIDKFKKHSILVVGDIILDEYIWGKASRLSPEAPVPVIDVEEYSYILGGAANVANNIVSLGGSAILAGVIGDDNKTDIIQNALKDTNIDHSLVIIDKTRPTTVKTRLMAHNHQQLARADRESKSPVSLEIQEKILASIKNNIDKIDLILLSDYAKGVLTEDLTKKIIELANKHNKPTLIDPKGLNYSKYTNGTLITPNRLEAELATKSSKETTADILANKLAEQINIEHILVTLGEDGVLIKSNNQTKIFPAVTSDVYDVTGAGDTLISAIALSLPASKNNIEAAVIIGNYAAGIAVRKTGTTSITDDELKHIIEVDFMKNQEINCGASN